MPSEKQTALLEMRNVSKTFVGTKALDKVELRAWGGEIHALMGENGAGKSTLMKILSGAYEADPGSEILIDGQRIEIDGPLSAKQHGISIIYQELSLAPNLTVAENIYLGQEITKRGVVDRRAMFKGCRGVLERLGANFRPQTIVGRLSIAEQQLVEIGRALHAESKILVLDEPTTTLSSRETERLFALIRQLREEGIALIYISHRMEEVYDLSDRVSVLRDGKYVGTIDRAELSAQQIVKMMVGRDLSTFYMKEHDPHGSKGPVIFEAEGVTDGVSVKPSSLEVHRGEVLGIAGLVGSGRTELARLIFGADEKTGGRIFVEGQEVRIRQPLDALRHGVAYVTEDRKGLGLFLDMSCADNINIGVLAKDARTGGILDLVKGRARAKSAFEEMRVRAASPMVNVGSLSGGNQQKILLSRWLQIGPKILILDEPTRGVDIGAKSEIYRLIDDLAKKGIGVIVISSELAEIIGVCDRVLVMREGEIVGEVGGPDGRPITQENIMALAAGVVESEAAM